MIEEPTADLMAPALMAERLQDEVSILKRLVESMALKIPRSHLPDDERDALDRALDRVISAP